MEPNAKKPTTNASSDCRKANLIISIVLMSLGILFNQWLIDLIYPGSALLDNSLSKLMVFIIEALLFAVGAYILIKRGEITKKHYLFSAITVFLFFLFSLLVDLLLGVFGFLSEHEIRYANPPNIKMISKSIEFEVEFQTNSQGLRYREIPFEKESKDKKRIFVVGDSFTQGVGVEQEETFAALLERYYSNPQNEVLFINGGLSAGRPLSYLNTILNIGMKYDIDGVLICLHANDLGDTSSNKDFSINLKQSEPIRKEGVTYVCSFLYPRIYRILKNFMTAYSLGNRDVVRNATRKARTKGIPEDKINSWIQKVPKELVDAANRNEFNRPILESGLLYPDYWTITLDMEGPDAEQRRNNMIRVLNFTVSKCRESGVEVAVAYLPCGFQHDPDFHTDDNPWVKVGTTVKSEWLECETRFQQNLRKWSESSAVPYFDLTESFRVAEKQFIESMNFPLDSHWNPLGYKVAAKAISEWLNEIKFLNIQESFTGDE